jgi:hypothetical protein
MGRMITRSMSRNMLKKRMLDHSYEKPRKRARRPLVDYYTERPSKGYVFIFAYILFFGFTFVMLGYAVVLAIV